MGITISYNIAILSSEIKITKLDGHQFVRKLFYAALLSICPRFGIGEHLSEVEGRDGFGTRSVWWQLEGVGMSGYVP